MQIELHEDDYVLMKDGKPVEALTVIYHHSSVIRLFNTEFILEDGEAFVSMTELPAEVQEQYIEAISASERIN